MAVRRAALRISLAALVVLAGCTGSDPSGDAVGEGAPTPVTDDLGEPPSTVPTEEALVAAVSARLLDAVPDAIGIVFLAEQQDCIRGALQRVDPDALTVIGLDGSVVEQPKVVQDAVFGAFDGCVDASLFADLAAPILMLAGVDEAVARCVMTGLRADLGFAGLYRFGISQIGEADHDPGIDARVSAAYAACDLDPTGLTVPTGPTTTVDPASSSTTAVSTTTTVATTGTETVPSTTVEEPLAPPEDVVGSSIPLIPATTVAAVPGSSPTTSVAP